MSDPIEERLAELETRLAFVDDLVASLNDTIAAHDRQLHALQNSVDRMRHELVAARGALTHAVRDASDETPPPHY